MRLVAVTYKEKLFLNSKALLCVDLLGSWFCDYNWSFSLNKYEKNMYGVFTHYSAAVTVGVHLCRREVLSGDFIFYFILLSCLCLGVTVQS